MTRVVVPELMDDPAIDPQVHEHALAGLARLNRWSFGSRGLWRVLKAEAIRIAPRPLRVLDLATGSGDLPIALARKAQRAKLNMTFAACDLSSTALTVAERHAAGLPIAFFQHDALRQPLPGGYDALIVSLFLHHLSEREAIDLLRNMAEAAERLILVNDLNRSAFNVRLVTGTSRLLTRSPIVHHDGPASVRAAFTLAEARELASKAGLSNVELATQFPCRWLLTWRKPA